MYRYQPVEHQVSQFGPGKDEALYNEPAQMPEGKLRIESLGVVEIKSKLDSKTFSALHLRMSVTNQSTVHTWKIGNQDQFVSFPNDGQSKPLTMDSSHRDDVDVGPGQLKTLDYYFPLPDKEMKTENLPQFDFHWQLETGKNHVEETTSFDRVQIHEIRQCWIRSLCLPLLRPMALPSALLRLGRGVAWARICHCRTVRKIL